MGRLYNKLLVLLFKEKIMLVDIDKITEEQVIEINKSRNKIIIIKASKKQIKEICDLLEKINYLKKVKTPFKRKVAKELRNRHTYQGFKQSILNYVKREIILNVNSNDIVVDATVGNGNDTLFLAKIAKKVIGLDIQEEALRRTREKLQKFSNVSLKLMSHEYIGKLKEKNIKLIIFNLGYLPNGDKNITTHSTSTLKAIKESIKVLSADGLILVVVYPGHKEGQKEAKAILEFLQNSKYYYEIKRNTNNVIAPFLVIIKKNFSNK